MTGIVCSLFGDYNFIVCGMVNRLTLPPLSSSPPPSLLSHPPLLSPSCRSPPLINCVPILRSCCIQFYLVNRGVLWVVGSTWHSNNISSACSCTELSEQHLTNLGFTIMGVKCV